MYTSNLRSYCTSVYFSRNTDWPPSIATSRSGFDHQSCPWKQPGHKSFIDGAPNPSMERSPGWQVYPCIYHQKEPLFLHPCSGLAFFPASPQSMHHRTSIERYPSIAIRDSTLLEDGRGDQTGHHGHGHGSAPPPQRPDARRFTPSSSHGYCWSWVDS